jgi:hypothetical protein
MYAQNRGEKFSNNCGLESSEACHIGKNNLKKWKKLIATNTKNS